MSIEKNREIQIKMLAKAWSDDNYKRKLKADPTAVCREEGMVFDGEMTVSDREAAPNIFYLPPAPEGVGGMNETDLEKQASDLISGDKEMF